ncbi:Pentatricopeptide repeat-containing protein [Dorcoceras hygrometricum]|uniref:Pentatricopeptide repeat-containing protein n=1 Tax=Dorcoceras hygrometricum TaxID=472368 RepID=A0A2Z7AAR9_9LAMI|nr:Pentatricopeptide repeat-containing protein [Dorcoceras hygrometricum]
MVYLEEFSRWKISADQSLVYFQQLNFSEVQRSNRGACVAIRFKNIGVAPLPPADEGTADEDAARVNEPTTEPAVADIVNEEPSTADKVDDIIDQVFTDTAQIIVDEEDQVVRTSVVTASDTDEEVESMDVGAAGGDQQVQFSVEEPEDMEMNDELIDADEKMSLDEIILTIPAELPLPSSEREVTKITIGTEIKIPGVDEKTWEGYSAVHLKVIDMLSDLLYFVLEELKQQAVAHRIRWTRPCCSILFEGRLTTHRNIPAYTIFEVSSQRQYDDTLPLVSDFFKLLKKRWGDVCLEAVEFCSSRRLLPVGSLNFCRALAVVEPDSSFDYRQPTVFALRFSQFCTVYIQYSLFNRLTTADISSFVASIASERTVLRNVQIAQNTVSVAPIVQLIDEPSSSDSTSDDISMDFADQDTAAAASISLPAAPIPDVTKALNQLRASIDQIRERDDGGAKHKDTLLLHLHDFEKQLQSSHKQLGTQIVTTGLDVVDVRRVVRETHQELNAKINSLDEQVAATRHDLLDFSTQAQQTLNIISNQLSELVAYINRGGNDKKGEVVSSSRPQPPPDDQIRGSGNPGGGGDIPQRDIDNAQRTILERLMSADRAREREKRSKSRSGS